VVTRSTAADDERGESSLGAPTERLQPAQATPSAKLIVKPR
jgi:hypothetical protein